MQGRPPASPSKASSGRQAFSQQKGGQRKRTILELKTYIQDLAGSSEHDEIELLTALIHSKFGKRAIDGGGAHGAHHGVHGGIKNESKKLRLLINTIKARYQESTSHNKRQWSSLVAPIFTRKDLETFGWKFCSEVFLFSFPFLPSHPDTHILTHPHISHTLIFSRPLQTQIDSQKSTVLVDQYPKTYLKRMKQQGLEMRAE
jgi:hypothetical protein